MDVGQFYIDLFFIFCMVIVPFIYFSFLIYFQYRKNGGRFDLACYILSIFAISDVFSALMVALDMEPAVFGNYSVSLFATVVYCLLITICTYPFIKYSNIYILDIKPIKQIKLLKIMAVFFFLFFVIDTVMNFKILYDILTGDFGQVRHLYYTGESASRWEDRFPYIIAIAVQYLHFLLGSPWILVFLAFYSFFIQKLPAQYGVLFLITSLIGIEGNLLSAGRSDIIYWLIGVGACLVFFSPYISKKQWKKLRLGIYPMIALFVVLMYITTMSKFASHEDVGDMDAGSASFIAYAGQPFLFFCFFFDNFDCPMPSLEAIFPYTYFLMGKGHLGIVDLQDAISAKSRFDLGVFYTFIGQIAVTSSNFVAILYCFFVTVLSNGFVSRTAKKVISLRLAFFYMLFASVLFLGLFSHYYAILTKTFSVIGFSFIFWFLNLKTNNGRVSK